MRVRNKEHVYLIPICKETFINHESSNKEHVYLIPIYKETFINHEST